MSEAHFDLLRKMPVFAGLSDAALKLILQDAQAVEVVAKFALPEPVAAGAAKPPPVLPGQRSLEEVAQERGRMRAAKAAGDAAKAGKVGRNDPCPCGSGKKYKKCHGLVA